ncbi:IS30 family transposase [Jatrophihabitans sp. YIM 134969]
MPAALDPAVKRAVFDRLRAGQRPVQIAAEMAGVGVSDKLVRKWRAQVGGVIPAPAKGNCRYLGRDERYEIARLHELGRSMRAIGRALRRDVATVSRELQRNVAPSGRYEPERAHTMAVTRRRRPQPTKLQRHPALAERVQSMLEQRFSPQEVAGRLPLLFPDDESMRISHETIYQAIYIRDRGELRRQLKADLRTRRTVRRPHGSSRRGVGGAISADAPSIHDRPAEIEDRLVPGDWEGDLIVGAGGRSAVGTLVERVSGYVCLLHLPDGHGTMAVTDAVIAAFTAQIGGAVSGIPAGLMRTLTWDRGYEMAAWPRLQAATDVKVYFADPYSPWQRGSNENTNGLLREYWPRGTDLSVIDVEQLNAVADQLNRRPRKRHGYHTPAEVLDRFLAQAGVATPP